MKILKFSYLLGTRENTDVFITLYENINGIHRKTVNILYLVSEMSSQEFHLNCVKETEDCMTINHLGPVVQS